MKIFFFCSILLFASSNSLASSIGLCSYGGFYRSVNPYSGEVSEKYTIHKSAKGSKDSITVPLGSEKSFDSENSTEPLLTFEKGLEKLASVMYSQHNTGACKIAPVDCKIGSKGLLDRNSKGNFYEHRFLKGNYFYISIEHNYYEESFRTSRFYTWYHDTAGYYVDEVDSPNMNSLNMPIANYTHPSWTFKVSELEAILRRLKNGIGILESSRICKSKVIEQCVFKGFEGQCKQYGGKSHSVAVRSSSLDFHFYVYCSELEQKAELIKQAFFDSGLCLEK